MRYLRNHLPGFSTEGKEMVEKLTSSLIQAIQQNGAWSVFWGAIIEQLAGVLIPSPIIPMSAGFLLIPKGIAWGQMLSLALRQVSLPYAIGATFGASFFYLAAFYGGRAFLEKFGKFIGISVKNIDKFCEKFTRGWKDEAIIFLLLILPVTSISLVSATCGIIGIKALEFIPILFVGIFLRAAFLAGLGWKVGDTYHLLAEGIDKAKSLVSLGMIGVAFAILAFLYYKRQKILKD